MGPWRDSRGPAYTGHKPAPDPNRPPTQPPPDPTAPRPNRPPTPTAPRPPSVLVYLIAEGPSDAVHQPLLL